MKSVDAYAKLLLLKQSIITTADAAVCLKVTRAHASKLLERLGKAGIIISLARGLWSLVKNVDPLELPEYLTAPFPSYISLQTALYYHGMISQMPSVVYAVSLTRARRYRTPFGVISIHHMDSSFFSDYMMVGDTNSHIKMATPEKALLDVFYLAPAKSNLFKLLPELELPKKFDVKKAYQIIRRIKSTRRRTIVKKKFEDIILT